MQNRGVGHDTEWRSDWPGTRLVRPRGPVEDGDLARGRDHRAEGRRGAGHVLDGFGGRAVGHQGVVTPRRAVVEARPLRPCSPTRRRSGDVQDTWYWPPVGPDGAGPTASDVVQAGTVELDRHLATEGDAERRRGTRHRVERAEGRGLDGRGPPGPVPQHGVARAVDRRAERGGRTRDTEEAVAGRGRRVGMGHGPGAPGHDRRSAATAGGEDGAGQDHAPPGRGPGRLGGVVVGGPSDLVPLSWWSGRRRRRGGPTGPPWGGHGSGPGLTWDFRHPGCRPVARWPGPARSAPEPIGRARAPGVHWGVIRIRNGGETRAGNRRRRDPVG